MKLSSYRIKLLHFTVQGFEHNHVKSNPENKEDSLVESRRWSAVDGLEREGLLFESCLRKFWLAENWREIFQSHQRSRSLFTRTPELPVQASDTPPNATPSLYLLFCYSICTYAMLYVMVKNPKISFWWTYLLKPADLSPALLLWNCTCETSYDGIFSSKTSHLAWILIVDRCHSKDFPLSTWHKFFTVDKCPFSLSLPLYMGSTQLLHYIGTLVSINYNSSKFSWRSFLRGHPSSTR